VVEELVGGAVTRAYTYGYERISESQTLSHAWTPSFYIYDGRGTVRMLASLAGAVTDTYEYDAFGNLLAKTGATPNVYLYRGERYDPDLKLYYLRARWYNPVTGRFMTRDPYAGSPYDPASLHRYNYARSNPSNFVDPSGRAALIETGFNLANSVAKNAAITATGIGVACMIRADAGILYLVGESSRSNQTVIDAKADFKNCMASVTVEQFAGDMLFNWGFGLALEQLGGMLPEALQGVLATAGFSGARQFAEGAEAGAAGDTLSTGGRKFAFSQTTASPWFHADGSFAGQTISDVADQLRSGALSTADVPVRVVTIDGNTLIVNTRSSLALYQAGIPESSWNIIDLSGDPQVVNDISKRLANNELTTSGTPTLRITGLGQNASTYYGAGTIPQP
jgi:RHS repeat-associated protein